MKSKYILDNKLVDFAKNTIIYDKLINCLIINDFKNINKNLSKYDLVFNQYERHNQIIKWYIELKFNSVDDDIFKKQLIDIIEKTDNIYVFAGELKKLIATIHISNKEFGHLLYYAWYLTIGCPFSNNPDKQINQKNYKEIGYTIMPFVRNFIAYEEEINYFISLIFNIKDKKLKKAQTEYINKQKKECSITLKELKKLIIKSSLHDDIKKEFFNNIVEEYQNINEMCTVGVIIHDDTLFDSIGEKSNWITHFSQNLKNFPCNIITEHHTLLYEKYF